MLYMLCAMLYGMLHDMIYAMLCGMLYGILYGMIYGMKVILCIKFQYFYLSLSVCYGLGLPFVRFGQLFGYCSS